MERASHQFNGGPFHLRNPHELAILGGCLLKQGLFLPEDAMQRFYYEGSGSPTISLSTLGDNEVDSETDDSYEDMNNMGEKFKKLARIYGVPPSVTFSPHDEFIGE